MHHFFEVAGRVSAVLTGQTSVLFIDELKLSEKLLHLTLERLGMKKNVTNRPQLVFTHPCTDGK